MRYTRKLSPIERYSLVLNKVCHYDLIAVVEGYGDLNVSRLREAVKHAAEANPGMRIRLRSFLGFTKWVDSGIEPQVNELAIGQWNARSEVGADFLETGFNPLDGGPICDVLYLPGAPNRIVFRATHAAADGRGMKHWVEEVFRALRDEPLVGAFATEREIDIMKKYQEKIPDALKPKKRAISPLSQPVVAPSRRNNAKLRYVWRSVSIPGDSGNVLPKTAMFLATYARRHTKGHVSFTIPVDLRASRESLFSTGNLTGYLNIIVEESDTARTVMKQINQKIRDHMDCLILPFIRLVPWIPLARLYKDVRKMLDRSLYDLSPDLPTGGLVSMGFCPLRSFSCAGFAASNIVGIPGFVGKLNVVMVNQSTHTTVTFAVPEAYNEDGQIEELVAAYRSHFESRVTLPETTAAHV